MITSNQKKTTINAFKLFSSGDEVFPMAFSLVTAVVCEISSVFAISLSIVVLLNGYLVVVLVDGGPELFANGTDNRESSNQRINWFEFYY